MSEEIHSRIPNECYQERIKELAEICDNEYHMSALPSTTNKERAERGKSRILHAIEEFKELQPNIKCVACRDEINKQIAIQEEGIREIEQAWNF